MTPAILTLSKLVSPSTSISPFKSIPVATIDAVLTVPAKVETPATLKLSKLVCPSTSISALISKLPPKVETPVTLNDFVVEELDTLISTASIGPTLYLSVPVPTTPFNS